MTGKELGKRTSGKGFTPGFVQRPIIGVQEAERTGRSEAATAELYENIELFLVPYNARFAHIADFYNSRRVTEATVGIDIPGLRGSGTIRRKLRPVIQSSIQKRREERGRKARETYPLPDDALLRVTNGDSGIAHPLKGIYHIDRNTGQPIFDNLTMKWPRDPNTLLHVTFSDGKISTVQLYTYGADKRKGVSFNGANLNWLDSGLQFVNERAGKINPAVRYAPKIMLGSISYHFFDGRTATQENPTGFFVPARTNDEYGDRGKLLSMGLTYDDAGRRPSVSIDTYFEQAKALLDMIVPDSEK